jgi:cytochrome oxidase Cu insertion factor (SCO1/SenC/PrrC family)
VLAAVIGASAGVLIELVRSNDEPAPSPVPAISLGGTAAASWPAGAKPAPGFTLRDEHGRPISLAAFRGRPLLLTFMDPVCTDFCPREAAIINRALALVPAAKRPSVVAISANRFEQSPAILRHDRAKWHLGARWHWAVGGAAAERRVWSGYGISVMDSPKVEHGKITHEITHTAATYVIDGRGDERALFLYPFRAADIARTLRALGY